MGAPSRLRRGGGVDLARARAIRRCGELLKEVEKQQGGDRKSKEACPPFDRKTAAKEAGMSPDQAKTAIRVANVPQESPEVDGGEIRVEVSTRRRPTRNHRRRSRGTACGDCGGG
jgi:hypothetical protein